MKKLFLIGLILSITSCVSVYSDIRDEHLIGKIPSDKLVHRVFPGEILYTEYDYRSTSYARVYGMLRSENSNIVMTSDLIFNRINYKDAYCGNFHVANLSYNYYGCFTDADSDGYFEKYTTQGISLPITTGTKYIKSTIINEGFKYELIFQKKTEKTLKFKYKEYYENMAQPNVIQDLEYPFNKNNVTIINFKGLKITIISVKYNYIKYKINGEIETN